MPYLQTDRLTIIPFSFDLIKAMANKKELEKLLHVEVPREFENVQFEDFLPFHLDDTDIAKVNCKWEGILIHTSDEKVIGTMGFKNTGDASGNLEVGYHLIPDYRNKGYAVEMANALVSWVFSDKSKEENADSENIDAVMKRLGLSRLKVQQNVAKDKINEEKFIKKNKYI
ncbi:GNAT family N-acetyltransferase [Alkalihalobacillus sp. R86527]|uniref:GNAT family N-acetyltransferase n=1 Tax=Alkalihalobacillus sp. R86527 TaxID=3093863 RepID=UPI003670F4C4